MIPSTSSPNNTEKSRQHSMEVPVQIEPPPPSYDQPAPRVHIPTPVHYSPGLSPIAGGAMSFPPSPSSYLSPHGFTTIQVPIGASVYISAPMSPISPTTSTGSYNSAYSNTSQMVYTVYPDGYQELYGNVLQLESETAGSMKRSTSHRGKHPEILTLENTYLGATVLSDNPSDVDTVNRRKLDVEEMIKKNKKNDHLTESFFDYLAREPRNTYLSLPSEIDLSKLLSNRIGLMRPNYLLGMRGLLFGPVMFDAYLLGAMIRRKVHESHGNLILRTNTAVEILLDRNHEELQILSHSYEKFWGNTMKEDISSSPFLYKPYTIVLRKAIELSAQRMVAKPMEKIKEAVNELREVVKSKNLRNVADKLGELIVQFNVYELRAIWKFYTHKYKKPGLTKLAKECNLLSSERYMLWHALSPANPKYSTDNKKWGSLVPSDLTGQVEFGRIRRDAKALYKAMKGFGTKDTELVARVLRGFRSQHRWEAIHKAYQMKYKKSLEDTVVRETSGDYKNMMRVLITDGEYLKFMK